MVIIFPMMKGKVYIKTDMKMDSYQPKTPLLSFQYVSFGLLFFLIQKQSGSSVFYHNFDLLDPNQVENALNEVKFLLK